MNFISENIEIIAKLEKKFSNNMEFGSSLRENFGDNYFFKTLPNDEDLGREVRALFLEISDKFKPF